MQIPLSNPDISELEIAYVTGVLRTPNLSLGPKLVEFEQKIARFVGREHAIAVSSGTAGLHLIIRDLGIGEGDEVIYKSLLRKHGVQVISINEPVDDSAAGKLLEGMIEVIDDFYCTNLAEDVSRGLAENAAKGFFNGGSVPFGYRRTRMNIGAAQKSKLEPDVTQALTVVRVFREGSGRSGRQGNRQGPQQRRDQDQFRQALDFKCDKQDHPK